MIANTRIKVESTIIEGIIHRKSLKAENFSTLSSSDTKKSFTLSFLTNKIGNWFITWGDVSVSFR